MACWICLQRARGPLTLTNAEIFALRPRRVPNHNILRNRRNKSSGSTSTTTATDAAAASAVSAPVVPPPTRRQLLLQARVAAVPMIGFGFMDNIIMVQAGDAIDSTFGVTFGLATLTAAAWGNVCSDTSGVLFGGVVDAVVGRLNLTPPGLTDAQLRTKQVRMVSTLGALVGVVTGCLMGMSTLPFMDLEKKERLKRAKELETIFLTVLDDGRGLLRAERCTLYLYDEDKEELWTTSAAGGDAGGGGSGDSDDDTKNAKAPTPPGLNVIIKVPLSNRSLAGAAARDRAIVNVVDAYQDDRFDAGWDRKTGYRTKSVLAMPVVAKSDGRLVGVIQALNKIDGGSFTEDDEKLMQMMSTHIEIFVGRC